MGMTTYGVYHCLEEPDSSLVAVIWGVTQLVLTVASTVLLLISDVYYDEPPDSVVILEVVSISFFTIDYLLRIFFCPDLRDFAFDCLNAIDLLVIAPFFVLLLLHGNLREAAANHGILLRLMRLFRLARLSKFSHILTAPSPSDIIQNRNTDVRFHHHVEIDDSKELPSVPGLHPHAHFRQHIVEGVDTRYSLTRIVVDSVEGFEMPPQPTNAVTLEVSLISLQNQALVTKQVVVQVQDWFSQMFTMSDPLELQIPKQLPQWLGNFGSAEAPPRTSTPATMQAQQQKDMAVGLLRPVTSLPTLTSSPKGMHRARSDGAPLHQKPKDATFTRQPTSGVTFQRTSTDPKPPKTSQRRPSQPPPESTSSQLLAHQLSPTMPARLTRPPTRVRFTLSAHYRGKTHTQESQVLDLKALGLLKRFNVPQEKTLQFDCGARLLVLLRVEGSKKDPPRP